MTVYKKGEEIKTVYKKGEQISSAYKAGYLVLSKGGRFELRGDINDNVVGGTPSPTSYSIEGEKGDTGTFIVTVSPNANYVLAPASITGVSGIRSDNDITAPTEWVQDGDNVRGTFSYEFPQSGYGLNRTRTDNFTIDGQGTFIPTDYTFVITFTDLTGSNMSVSTLTKTVVGPVGTDLGGSILPSFTDGYVLSSLGASDNSIYIQITKPVTTFVEYKGTMPTGGGSANITVTGSSKLFVPPTYSGNIIYNVNAQIQTNITPTSYSDQAGVVVEYSGTLNANEGYEFNDGTTEKEVSGSITVPEGGGNVEVTFDDSVTVDCSSVSVSPNELDYTDGANKTATLTLFGSTYSSSTGLAEWLGITGEVGESKLTLTVDQNDSGSSRSDTFTIVHSNTCTSNVTVSQAVFVADTITLPTSSNFNASGGINIVSFNADGASNVVISDDMKWLRHTGPFGNSFNLIADPNEEGSRTATVTATKGNASDTMSVTQAGSSGLECFNYTWNPGSLGTGIAIYTRCDGTVFGPSTLAAGTYCAQEGTTDSIPNTGGSWGTKGSTCS